MRLFLIRRECLGSLDTLTKPYLICEGPENNKTAVLVVETNALRKIDERSNVNSRDRSTARYMALRFSKRKLVRGSEDRELFVRLPLSTEGG